MTSDPTPPSSLISPLGYELLVSSDRLREALLPDGLFTSPYEVLGYESRVVLLDAKGRRASFSRRQHIRFLQDGPSAILDHLWGDGLSFEYHNSAGPVVDQIRDGRYKHLVIDLGRQLKKGEKLCIETHRTKFNAFTKSQEWMEITIDHPVKKLRRSVLFPKERPCQQASLSYEGKSWTLPIVALADGSSTVRFEIARPRMNTTYALSFQW